jgi:hypothetical protein
MVLENKNLAPECRANGFRTHTNPSNKLLMSFNSAAAVVMSKAAGVLSFLMRCAGMKISYSASTQSNFIVALFAGRRGSQKALCLYHPDVGTGHCVCDVLFLRWLALVD